MSDAPPPMGMLEVGDSVEVELRNGDAIGGEVTEKTRRTVSVDPADGLTDRYVLQKQNTGVHVYREWWDDHDDEPRDEHLGVAGSVSVFGRDVDA